MARSTVSGPWVSQNGFIGDLVGGVTGTVTLPTFTVTTANALASKPAGMLIYVSNGLAGAPCVAVGNGTNWISPAGTAIAAA